METGWLSPSFRFRGRNADNNRFIAGRLSGFLPLRLNYETMEVEDFTDGMDKWRREQLERLAGGKEEYALSQGFIDYAEAFFQYGWAERMITYPAIYRRVNRGETRGITPEYYGFLERMSPWSTKGPSACRTTAPSWCRAWTGNWRRPRPPPGCPISTIFRGPVCRMRPPPGSTPCTKTALHRRFPGSSTWGNSGCRRPTERGSTPFSTGTTGRTSRRFPGR